MPVRDVMPVMSSKHLKQIPMDMIAPFEAQAKRNHGQSLDRLAERGGMCPAEILAVMDGLGWAAVKVCDENDLLLFRRVKAYVHQAQEQP